MSRSLGGSWLLGLRIEAHRLVAGALAVLNVIAAVLIDRLGDDWRLWLAVAVSLIVNLLLWLLGEWRATRLDRARANSRSETLVDLGHNLEPLTRELGRMAALSLPERRQERSGLVQAILSAATGLEVEAHQLRACYFKLAEPDDGPRRMIHKRSTGRAVSAKASFIAGTPAGDAALAMIDAGDYLFCDDVMTSPPPGWVPTERGEYKTFISVTVGTPGRPIGMLTLDAIEVGSLTEEDVRMLIVLGHLLAIVETLAA